MKNKKAVILDFDGVIADSKQAMYKAICSVADDRKVSHPSIESLQNNPSRFLFSHLEASWYEVPFIVRKLKKRVAENRGLITVIPNIADLLKISRDSFDYVHILSSNSTEFISGFLKENNLQAYFDSIYGDTSFFKKKSKLKTIIKNYDLAPHLSFYIGDETRDVEAANSATLNSLAVTWGMHSRSLLQTSQPHFIIDTPSEFRGVMEKVNDL
jgi:phosphoglycolate phosphatase